MANTLPNRPSGAAVQEAPPNQSTSAGSVRVIRGGGWNNDASYARAGSRSGFTPGYRGVTLGFRPVFTADEFIGVSVPMASVSPKAAAPVVPAAPAASAFSKMTDIVTQDNYKQLYLKGPNSKFTLDPAVRDSILKNVALSSSLSESDDRSKYPHYFGSMFLPLHDQDNYFYLLDLVGPGLAFGAEYSPTIFGWEGAKIPILKEGYTENTVESYRGEEYFRAHSPGMQSFFPGLGTNVYSAGAMSAAFNGKAGVMSRKGAGRTVDADEFWKRAVQTGLAQERGQHEFLAAKTVLKSPLYVRPPGIETSLTLTNQPIRYYTAHVPEKVEAGYNGAVLGSPRDIQKIFKSTPAVRKLRAEMLARSAFSINRQSVRIVYSMLQDIGIQSELDLFRSRPEIKGGTWLAGLRRYRLPPLSGESQTLLNGISNPY